MVVFKHTEGRQRRVIISESVKSLKGTVLNRTVSKKKERIECIFKSIETISERNCLN